MFQPLEEKTNSNFKHSNTINTIILFRFSWHRWQENDSHYTKRDVLTHLSRSPGVNTGTKIFTCWIQVIVSSFLSPCLVLLPISVGLVFILLPCNWQMKTSTLMYISVFLTICGSSIRGCIFSKVSAQMSKKNCDWPI